MPINDQFEREARMVLPQAADLLAREMRSKAPTEHIKGAIEVGQVEQMQNGFKIDITISLKDAPEAGAYEWGSGLHRERNPDTYVIKPKTKKLLAFDWPGHTPDYPVGRKYKGEASDGRLLFSFVDHPGVAARPYIRPSIAEKKDEIRQIIGRSFKIAILAAMAETLEVK